MSLRGTFRHVASGRRLRWLSGLSGVCPRVSAMGSAGVAGPLSTWCRTPCCTSGRSSSSSSPTACNPGMACWVLAALGENWSGSTLLFPKAPAAACPGIPAREDEGGEDVADFALLHTNSHRVPAVHSHRRLLSLSPLAATRGIHAATVCQRCISWADVLNEYPDTVDPFKQYINHLIQRFEGEVAIAWQNWEYESWQHNGPPQPS